MMSLWEVPVPSGQLVVDRDRDATRRLPFSHYLSRTLLPLSAFHRAVQRLALSDYCALRDSGEVRLKLVPSSIRHPIGKWVCCAPFFCVCCSQDYSLIRCLTKWITVQMFTTLNIVSIVAGGLTSQLLAPVVLRSLISLM